VNAQRELEKKTRQLEEARRAAHQCDRMAAADLAAADDLADEEAAGRVSADDVAKRLDALADSERRHRRNAAHHARVCSLLEQDVAELERRLEREPYDETIAKIPRVNDELQSAARQFVKLAGGFIKQAQRVSDLRDKQDALCAEARQHRPGWLDDDLEIADEPAWPDVTALIAFLQAGPREPAKRSAAAVTRQVTEREQSDRARLSEIVGERSRQLGGTRENDEQVLRQRFPSLLPRRDEVLDAIAAERERQRAAYEERQARAAHQPFVLGEV
jgi:rubrerythrin